MWWGTRVPLGCGQPAPGSWGPSGSWVAGWGQAAAASCVCLAGSELRAGW